MFTLHQDRRGVGMRLLSREIDHDCLICARIGSGVEHPKMLNVLPGLREHVTVADRRHNQQA